MSKFTPEELELIEVLKKYGSRVELKKANAPLYRKLLRCHREILDEAIQPSNLALTLDF